MSAPQDKNICILGLGNVLCGDDGFGCHAIALLQENYSFPAHVKVIDAGTQGQLLPGILKDADFLLLLDAADFNEKPGTLFEKSSDQIPAWLGMAKLSAHQGSFAEALAHSLLLGEAPAQIRLVGFQPVRMAFGGKISPECRNILPEAINLVKKWLLSLNAPPYPHQGKADMHPELRETFYTFCDNPAAD